MANHPSALKRHKQSEKRQLRNTTIRSRVRTAVKKVRALIDSGDGEAARAEMRVVERELRKAASKGVLHPNNASRRTGRLASQVAALS